MIFKSIDIFCEIIDNYGDIGVTYRLVKEFQEFYGDKIKIRIFLNKLEEFKEINKKVQNIDSQTIDNVEYYTMEYLEKNINNFVPGNVIIEMFACNLPKNYFEKAKCNSSLLFNFEYLATEKWAEETHLLESIIGDFKLRKFFFMPGFNKNTGGLIIDENFIKRKNIVKKNRAYFLKKYIPEIYSEKKINKNFFIGSIFSYEKSFNSLINTLLNNDKKNIILIFGKKSEKSIKKMLKIFEKIDIIDSVTKYENIIFKFMPFFSQEEYEEILCMTDYNFVRGEDSFVRGVLSGVPFIWHAYLQENMAHMDKVLAFNELYKKTIGKNEILNEISMKEALKVHTKLLIDYNDRKINSLNFGKEKYEDFFKNIDTISKLTEIYSNYLIENCNLIYNFNKFILKYQEG